MNCRSSNSKAYMIPMAPTQPEGVSRWVCALLLLLMINSVSAHSPSAELSITGAIVDPEAGETTVYVSFNNSLSQKAGAITFSLDYNEQVIRANSGLVYEGGVLSNNLSSPIFCSIVSPIGIPNGDVTLAAITFQPISKISSETELGLTVQTLVDTSLPPNDLIPALRVRNNTFRISTTAFEPIAPTPPPLTSNEVNPYGEEHHLTASVPLPNSTQDKDQIEIPEQGSGISNSTSYGEPVTVQSTPSDGPSVEATPVSNSGFTFATVFVGGILGLVKYLHSRRRT